MPAFLLSQHSPAACPIVLLDDLLRVRGPFVGVATLLENRNRTDRIPVAAEDLPANDQFACWVLSGPLTWAALAGLCSFCFLCWLPPTSPGLGGAIRRVCHARPFVDNGRLPYRDLPSTNFPGSIYLFWLLGKVFGWDRTVPVHCTDAVFLLTPGRGAAVLVALPIRFFPARSGGVRYTPELLPRSRLHSGGPARLARSRTCNHGASAARSSTRLGEPVVRRSGVRAGLHHSAQVVLFLPAVLMVLSSTSSSGKQRCVAVAGWLALFIAFIGLLFLPLIVGTSGAISCEPSPSSAPAAATTGPAQAVLPRRS